MWKFQGSIKKELEFPRVFMENSWNFHGSWFLTFEFLPTTVGFLLGQESQGKSGVFVRGSSKVREMRDFFKKVMETSGKKIFIHVNF